MVVGFKQSRSRAATLQRTDLGLRQPNMVPPFPLSSPQQETLTTFKPINRRNTLAPNDTFFSPNPFASSSSDDDTESSSGQDEFHLERYSQETTRNGQSSRPSRKQSRGRKQSQQSTRSRPEKKSRPGLNIVTNFSAQAQRTQADGIVIEQVQSQRPRLGPRYATSIMSSKAEHVSHSVSESLANHDVDGSPSQRAENLKRIIARQAVSKLQESQLARKAREMSKAKEMMDAGGRVPALAEEDELRASANATSDYSPGVRSIVIGMSVPEHELDAHRSAGGASNAYSANTPDTPAIVITPAEETDSWKPFFGKTRPISNTYSPHTRSETQIQHTNLPPVPKIPFRHAQHDKQGQPTAGASIIQSTRGPNLKYAESDESDDEQDPRSLEEVPRMSSDSQERILPSDMESRRHKSQGWWNLMLSPMLSRKGTIAEKANNKSPETPPVPSLPGDVRLSKSDVVSPLVSESPETPRRLGLASARASVWSRWTTWERERDGNLQSPSTNAPLPDLDQPPGLVQHPSQIPAMPAIDFTKGLAAEYYHACAVEQLTGVPYFECKNHSCADKLPKLHSIFDKEVAFEPLRDVHAPRQSDDNAGDDVRVPKNEERELRRGASIRSEPEDLSPNVRQAETAAVVKAKSVESLELMQGEKQQQETYPATTHAGKSSLARELSVPGVEPPRREAQYPNTAPVADQPPILSPGPVSPAMQHTMTSQGAVPMTQIDHQPNQPRLLEQTTPSGQQQALAPTQPSAITIHNHTFYSERSANGDDSAVGDARREAMERLEPTTSVQEVSQKQEVPRAEVPAATEPEAAKKGLMSKLKAFFRRRKADDKDADKKKKTRRWTMIIGIVLFFVVLACVLLATFLTRTGDGTPVQSQWLNLTGYPPIPTGISTVARPDVVKQQSQCVGPNTMWSCALPKEEQFEVAPNAPDQPNFRFEITFRNGTVPANMTIPVQELRRRSVADLQRRADDPFTSDLFDPNPTPPSRADQIFMGNTTDNITQPFEGEQTPFYITFIPVFPIDPSNATATTSSSTSSRLRRRQSIDSSDIIPAPDVLSDGSAAPANLLPSDPYPSSQPIKLYNRGQADEHYGFYIYYDKAIFLHSTAPLNTSEFADGGGVDPEDANGGSTREQSRLRCTFSQTRFLVRMWTNPAFGATLLPPISNGTNTTSLGSRNSATDFSRPGSFPYPATLSIDRHGGNVNKKAVYCYGVDQLQVIQPNVKTIVPELRNFGGTLINAAPSLVNGTVGDDTGFDQEAGGIDGGTGGCQCVWQNWN